MPSLSIEKSRTPKRAPKKGSAKSSAPRRRKVTLATVPGKKSPRSVVSKSEQAATAKTPVKAEESTVERITKQERMLNLLSRPEGASIEEIAGDRVAAAQRAGVFGRHGEKEARLFAELIEAR